jgi:outer membrane receptor protein involved in Fe transport
MKRLRQHNLNSHGFGFQVSLLILILFTLLSAPNASAQNATGSILGAVRDSTGAVLPNVRVRVTSEQTGQYVTVTTDELGNYTVPLLKPGSYSVSAEAGGFQRYVNNGIVLQVDQTARLNISMQVGDVTQTVDVTGEAPLLQSENASTGAVIDEKKIVQIPLNGRNFIDLAVLAPGVGRAGGSQGSSSLTIDGGRPQNNNFLLDGTANTDGDFNKAILSPSIDAIQEFKVQTSGYSAEFGRSGAGQINVITKSGGNDFHGVLYEFHRNSALDARPFNTLGSKLPKFIRHQFGGTFGGPIIKNKTFFFGNYEGIRRVQGLTFTGTVPTAAMRRGDFSGVAAIYDPAGETANPAFNPALPVSTTNPRTLRSQFAGNIIPDARINPITRKILDFVPLPTEAGLANNFRRNDSQRETNNQYGIRIDHQVALNNQFFARFNTANATTFAPGTFPGFGTDFENKPKNLTISDIHTFTPTFFNEFKFGYARLAEGDLQQNAYGQDYIAELGIAGVGFGGEAARGLPNFAVQGFTAFGDGTFALPRVLRNNTYQWIDNVTWLRGKHSFKGGVEATRFQYNLQAWFQSRGFFQFTNGYTTRTSTNDNTGNAFATYLLGLPYFAQRQVGQTRLDARSTRFGAYVQDDYKLSPRLTLNLGLRYEVLTPLAEINHFTANVDLENLTGGRPTIYIGGQNGYPGGLFPTDYNNIAPRIGFAFRPFTKAQTVIRGGYGVYFGADDGNTFFNHVRNVPNIIPQTIIADQFTPSNVPIGFTARARLGDPSIISSFGAMDTKMRTPYVQQFNLGVQHQLGRDWVFDIGYVGNIGKKLQRSRRFNDAPPGPGAIDPRRPYQAFQLADGLKPVVDFEIVSPVIPIGFTQVLENSAKSNYHALQVRVERRFVSGFTLLTSYSFGKALTDAPSFRSVGAEQDSIMDQTRLFLEYGRMGWDVRHRLVSTVVYELPIGKGKRFAGPENGVVQRLIGGWQLSGISNFQTGEPFTISVAGDTANIGTAGVNRANEVPGQEVSLDRSERTAARWFNTTAFSTPATFAFGTVGRNTIEGPGLMVIDAMLAKTTQLTERIGLQFRAEVFNLANHPNFGQPGRQVNTTQFGTITGQRVPARQWQFAAKLLF